MKQTAVEWLVKYMETYFHLTDDSIKAFRKAKKIEQEQIEEAFNNSYWFIDGREYYENTYGIHSKE